MAHAYIFGASAISDILVIALRVPTFIKRILSESMFVTLFILILEI